MKWPPFLSIALVFAATALSAVAASAPRPPNIIFIMADDLGYADIGAFGQKKIRTPHLDRFAIEGTKFTDYYPGAAAKPEIVARARELFRTARSPDENYPVPNP